MVQLAGRPVLPGFLVALIFSKSSKYLTRTNGSPVPHRKKKSNPNHTMEGIPVCLSVSVMLNWSSSGRGLNPGQVFQVN